MKMMMEKIVTVAMIATGLVALAKPSVEIKNVSLADARDGTVNYTYKVDGDFEGKEYDLHIKVSVANGTKSTVVTHESVKAETVSTNVNVKALFGKAYPNVTLFAELKKPLVVGVQLWEGGPIWADRNVGATKPEEYGYYFWWGDTEGYVRNAAGNGWVSAKDGTTTISFGAGASLSSSITLDALKSGGWVGDDGNLLAEHDAARVHLGGDWRIPTDAEIKEMRSKCYCQMTSQNGVYGVLIKGKDDYASKSIFMPAGGDGVGASRDQFPYAGYYWTATAADSSTHSCDIGMDAGQGFYSFQNFRYVGFSVRPVRDAK